MGAPAPTPISYSIEGAALAIGQSQKTITRAIAEGNLTPRYPNSKAIILHEELLAWARSLPVDRPGGAA